MGSSTDAFPTLRFSSADFPGRDGRTMWRELFARKMLRLDMELLADVPPSFELKPLRGPGLAVIAAGIGAARFARTHALTADGNDDYVLAVPRSGASGIVRRLRLQRDPLLQPLLPPPLRRLADAVQGCASEVARKIASDTLDPCL